VEATSAPRPLAARLPVPRRVLAAFSDDRLVQHARRGDAAAFEVIYDRHSAGILSFCRHMLGSASDAEDALQHTFIAAHNDLQRHGERDLHLKAWLYTIARNRCLSMLRSRREQATESIEIVSDNMSDEVQQRDDLRALLVDVRKLPDEQREALVLSEIGDLAHSDVADVLGCEVGKVKSLVFQARSSLIDRRLARETPCEEIREQLSTLRGGALRRSHLRHHLEACPGCSEFREQVRRQRAMLAVALPVIPSASLRGDVLAAVGLGGGTATAAVATGAGGLGLLAKGTLAKAGMVALLAGGTAGGVTVANNGTLPLSGGDGAPASQSKSGASESSNGSGGGAAGATVSDEDAGDRGADGKDGGPENRSESGREHGFTPTRGESNGARAREFAATRGKGKKKGLAKARREAAQRRRAKRQKRTKARRAPRPQARIAPKREPRAPTRATPAPKPQTTQPTPTTTTTTPTPAPEVPEAEIEPEPAPAPTVPAPEPGAKSAPKQLRLGAG
jgi:RNA polymerase sigma factor (sigma-70 family)